MPKTRPADVLQRLGNRLRARRLFLRLPPDYTAKQMKLSPSMLHAYEAGQAHPPVGTLIRMAKALGTTAGDLLGERRRGNTEDIERALRLFADPLIGEVADSMWRMDLPHRRAVVQGIREMA
ncbi:MAG TPA: helix-turn-helix transcriptional regulator [Candidatus Acidoferrum sp.]